MTETEQIGARRATITSKVDAPDTVAAAIAPDDTDEIDTRVENGRVVTTIERETIGGLEATIDDYVVALDVATTTAAHATDAPAGTGADSAAGTEAIIAGTEAGIEAGTEASDEDSTADSTPDERHTDQHDTHSP